MIDDDDFLFITTFFELKMFRDYVYCKLKKKYRGMGLRSTTLQKVLLLPDRMGRDVVVDHRDGNKLNNQKGNLRICTHQENMWNRKLQGGSSEYKGVSWRKDNSVWQTYIYLDRIMKHLGYFNNEEAAANCYNYFAMKYFGEFANLNDCSFMTKEEWTKQIIKREKSSKYRGVSFVEGKWLAQIYHLNKNIKIGCFDDEVSAAIAYNNKAIELKGSKAKLNNIN
ncbi:HNH endonuclease [Paenibacillus lactis]|uniref:HNH endonuclease n=1 Tax=Paenibacillus lactis TaxID=228574 RepID=UPI003D734882